MSAKFIRTIHPIAKTLSPGEGIVEYVASDETLDRDGEILCASGWRFTNFKKNAPFLNNHDYTSIASVLGKVIDARVVGKQLIETVQWAVDVPENTLAQIGFRMTDAGYLSAVSIGGLPLKIATNDGSREFRDLLKSFGQPPDARVKRIFLEQEQLELSACPLGSNPNALAKAYSDGIIPDSFIDKHPDLARLIEKSSARSYSFPTPTTPNAQDMKNSPFDSMYVLLGRKPRPAFAKAESFPGLPPAAAGRAAAVSAIHLGLSRENLLGDAIEKSLANPGTRLYWNCVGRYVMGQSIPDAQRSMIKALSDEVRQRLTLDGVNQPMEGAPVCRHGARGPFAAVAKTLGDIGDATSATFFIAQAMSEDVFDLLLTYGVFRTLGLRTMAKQYTKYAKISALPTSVFIPPSTQAAVAIPSDGAFTGASLLPEANYVASSLPVSVQLYEDAAVDFARVLLETFVKSIASTVDYACFQGNGNIDATNGGQTGIFVDNTIISVPAPASQISILTLDRTAFVNTVSAVAPAALQRPCSWWINPAFLAPLLNIREGEHYLLKTPAETGDGTWRILGFPVNWASQAPSASTPGSKIAAFGDPDCYLVALREEMEMDSSPVPGWNTLQKYVRAYSRVWCQTREATGLATLALAVR